MKFLWVVSHFLFCPDYSRQMCVCVRAILKLRFTVIAIWIEYWFSFIHFIYILHRKFELELQSSCFKEEMHLNARLIFSEFQIHDSHISSVRHLPHNSSLFVLPNNSATWKCSNMDGEKKTTTNKKKMCTLWCNKLVRYTIHSSNHQFGWIENTEWMVKWMNEWMDGRGRRIVMVVAKYRKKATTPIPLHLPVDTVCVCVCWSCTCIKESIW